MLPTLKTPAEIEAATGGTLTARQLQREVRLGRLAPPVVVRLGRKILVNEALLIQWLTSGGTAAVAGEPGATA